MRTERDLSRLSNIAGFVLLSSLFWKAVISGVAPVDIAALRAEFSSTLWMSPKAGIGQPEAVPRAYVPAGLAVAEGKRVTCRLIVLLCNKGL